MAGRAGAGGRGVPGQPPQADVASRMAADASGNFVVVWQAAGRPVQLGVFAQRYDASGAPIGGRVPGQQPDTFAPGLARGRLGSAGGSWSSGRPTCLICRSSARDEQPASISTASSDSATTRRARRSRVPGQHRLSMGVSSLACAGAAAASSSRGRAPGGPGSRRLRPRYDRSGAPRGSRVPRQHLHVRRTRVPVRSRPTPPATSWWCGAPRARMAAHRACSASATTLPDRRAAPSSGSTPTRTGAQAGPSVASDAAGNFVVAWVSAP